MSEAKHYCIEYIDEDGENVVRHAILTYEEKQMLLEEFQFRKINASFYDLSCVQTEDDSNGSNLLSFSGDE